MILGEDGTTPVPLYGPGIASRAMPTLPELQANDDLIQHMLTIGNIYETDDSSYRRRQVIQKIQNILESWATDLGISRGISEEFLDRGGGIQLLLFGSTRLEVHNVDSDIDTLCVAPSFIQRQDFFNSLCDLLSRSVEVEALLSIPDAYTPVVKFVIDGHSVDMVFAALQVTPLSNPIDLLDLRCLHGLDEQSVRSLNGVRVAEWICRLVPNLPAYRMALRVIKYWAKQRGLYSSILGFLGGVNFAILVAQIGRLYVNACPFTLVEKFFAVYSTWIWPTPVMLRPYEDLRFTSSDGRYLPVWNSFSNFKDAQHLMPIITPAYPAMNSAYNISRPQFRYIQAEIVRAHVMFQNASIQAFPWTAFFEPCTRDFFRSYPRYIQIDISAKTATDQRIWFGWVESRMRYLIISLEKPPEIFCHPTANCFHRRPQSRSPSPSTVEKDKNSSDSKKELSASKNVDRSEDRTETELESNLLETEPLATITEESSIFMTPKRESHPSTASSSDDIYVSSYFIALSFQEGLVRADVSQEIIEFSEKVYSWKDRKPDMDLNISTFDIRSVPSFVYFTKAEPSNIKSCTPKPSRRKKDLGESLDAVPGDDNWRSPSANERRQSSFEVLYENEDKEETEFLENRSNQRIYRHPINSWRKSHRNAAGGSSNNVLFDDRLVVAGAGEPSRGTFERGEGHDSSSNNIHRKQGEESYYPQLAEPTFGSFGQNSVMSVANNNRSNSNNNNSNSNGSNNGNSNGRQQRNGWQKENGHYSYGNGRPRGGGGYGDRQQMASNRNTNNNRPTGAYSQKSSWTSNSDRRGAADHQNPSLTGPDGPNESSQGDGGARRQVHSNPHSKRGHQYLDAFPPLPPGAAATTAAAAAPSAPSASSASQGNPQESNRAESHSRDSAASVVRGSGASADSYSSQKQTLSQLLQQRLADSKSSLPPPAGDKTSR